MGATQHLVQSVVRVKLFRRGLKNTDADLGVLENRTEQPLACLQGVLRTRTFGDVFGQTDNALGPSGRVPEQLKLPVAEDDAAVPANETLLIFIRLPPALDKFRISLCAGVTVLLGDNRVPLV